MYINTKVVVLVSEPVGGRTRGTELPCLSTNGTFSVIYLINNFLVNCQF